MGGALSLSAADLGIPAGFVDYHGLIASGVWAPGCAPTYRTLVRWVRAKRIPFLRCGRIVRFHPPSVAAHIMATQTVAPVGPRPAGSGNVRRRYQRRARPGQLSEAAR
jgi:hypothetical protein